MPENDSPESTPVDPAPRKRGRKPLPPGQARDCPHVINLRSDESARAKAWAAAQGRPLGECIRSLLLPLIGACAIMLSAAGCGASSGALAGGVAIVKPIGCSVARALVEHVCDGASAGGEAAAPE